MKRPLRVASLAALVLLLLLVPGRTVHAHQPSGFNEQNAVFLDNPLVSYALYGDIDDPREVFEVRLKPTTPLALPIEVLVPRRDHLEDHRPIFVIVAAGLPPPTDAQRALLPRALPEGTGVLFGSEGPSERESIFESFTRRVFWTNGVTAFVLPAGEVQIWIWSPRGTTGDFVLGIGVEEEGIDLGNVLSNWGQYAY